jgi:hypothetical protein
VSSAAPSAAASIRRAVPADVPAVRDLLTRRDERAWDDESTRWFVHDLDPKACVAWIAWIGDRPVGLSTMFLRRLRGPAGSIPAGYWANLFIDPAHRDLMLYPRLPLAMFAGARELGIEIIYGSVRLHDLVQAHARIGFAKLGRLAVLARPIRPFGLVFKHRGWPGSRSLAPLDAVYRGWLGVSRARPAPGTMIEDLNLDGPDAARLVEMIDAAAATRVVAEWTPESLRYRYRQTREGGRYLSIGVRRRGALIAAIVYRIAERWNGITAGVVMDAVAVPGEESSLAGALAAAERHAERAGCELMMFLDGLGAQTSRVFARCGYVASPESYEMILWPRTAVTSSPPLARQSSWRFGFGDHDAF